MSIDDVIRLTRCDHGIPLEYVCPKCRGTDTADPEGLRALKARGWLKHADGCSWEFRKDDGSKECSCGLLAALSKDVSIGDPASLAALAEEWVTITHAPRIAADNVRMFASWLKFVTPQPAAPAGARGYIKGHADPRYRPLMLVVRAADRSFEKSGDAGTKPWLDDHFLPEMEAHGLTIAVVEEGKRP